MPTIEIYPSCVKPDWLVPGAKCYCLGEAYDVFIVDRVFDRGATLKTKSGLAHGMESFTKLYQSMTELEQRRPELREKTVTKSSHGKKRK